MRSVSIAAAVLVTLMSTSCGGGGGWPNEQDISNSLEATLRSVSGDWTGVANAPNALRLEFRLQDGANGQVSGSGTIKETSTSPAIPVTVTGSFQRPTLTLTFEGIVYESRLVKGVVQGTYTTVGGIATTLMLTAPGYSREIPILLQEK
jgi:hypothetical protein